MSTYLVEQKIIREVDDIDISETAYKTAEQRYNSVGEWLERDDSELVDKNPVIYTQGSFALGTVIKPLDSDEDYDIDLVVDWSENHSSTTQFSVKEALGRELKKYTKARGMNEEPEEGRRCWTLHYASSDSEPGFHLDALPGISHHDYRTKTQLFEATNNLKSLELNITDNESDGYKEHGSKWLVSNPRGYALWFHEQQKNRRKLLTEKYAGELRMEVTEVPKYAVKTPLQRAVQFLKRHRDVLFRDNPDVKPISIIITTLAAHIYNDEKSVWDVIVGFLDRHGEHIKQTDGIDWIPNPVNLKENFADKWEDYPERKKAFEFWISQLREDLVYLYRPQKEGQADKYVSHILTENSHRAELWKSGNQKYLPSIDFNVPHKQAPRWDIVESNSVKVTAQYKPRQGGFRWKTLPNDGREIPKWCDLRFTARTNAPRRPKVKYYWQVVNTGREAAHVNCLRGGFYDGEIKRGGKTRYERTQYTGTHWVQCYITRNGKCIGVSEEFIVQIQ